MSTPEAMYRLYVEISVIEDDHYFLSRKKNPDAFYCYQTQIHNGKAESLARKLGVTFHRFESDTMSIIVSTPRGINYIQEIAYWDDCDTTVSLAPYKGKYETSLYYDSYCKMEEA